jgi:hypothetical protein
MMRLYRVVASNGLRIDWYEFDGTRIHNFMTLCEGITVESGEPILNGLRRHYKWESPEKNLLGL